MIRLILHHAKRRGAYNVPSARDVALFHTKRTVSCLKNARHGVLAGSLDSSVRMVVSLDRKCPGTEAWGAGSSPGRGIFDKETRRKPLVVAADAVYGD